MLLDRDIGPPVMKHWGGGLAACSDPLTYYNTYRPTPKPNPFSRHTLQTRQILRVIFINCLIHGV